MPIVSLNSVELYYELAGDGPPLMLIAGLASDNASWAPVIPMLSPRYTLIMPDNRGCGRTKIGDAPVHIDAIASDFVELLDHLNL
ncbi:lipolytic enzyme, partial [Enterococcus hirae]